MSMQRINKIVTNKLDCNISSDRNNKIEKYSRLEQNSNLKLNAATSTTTTTTNATQIYSFFIYLKTINFIENIL